MEISYQLTIDDYRQGLKAFRRKTTYSIRRTRFLFGCFWLVLATASFLSLFGRDKSFPNLFPLWGLAAFWACVLWYSPYYLGKKMMKGPSAALPHSMEISDEGIHSHTAGAEVRLTWEVLVGWAEVERVFALFPSHASFFPIPKRAMTDAQQKELRALLTDRISTHNASKSL